MLFVLALLAMQAPAANPGYEQGVALIAKGQMEAAIPFLTRGTQAAPGDARTWKALGVAYAASNQYERAEPAFARACALDPKLEDACYYQARALYALNRFEPSLQILQREPKSWKVLLGIGQAFEALGRPEDAENAFKSSLETVRGADPGPGSAYGLFLLRQGRANEAVGPLRQVLTRFPDAPEAHIHLARAFLEEGKVEAAIPLLERAVAMRPASSQAHLLLGRAYVRAQRTAEAQAHFSAAERYEDGSRTVK